MHLPRYLLLARHLYISAHRIAPPHLVDGVAFGFEEAWGGDKDADRPCAAGGDVEPVGVEEEVHAAGCVVCGGGSHRVDHDGCFLSLELVDGAGGDIG